MILSNAPSPAKLLLNIAFAITSALFSLDKSFYHSLELNSEFMLAITVPSNGNDCGGRLDSTFE
jgi:hypothetical protein